MRSTVVDALYSNNGYWYIVVSPSSVNSTYIITVDSTTGNPLYTGIPFIDIFPDHSMALKNLTEIGAQRKIHGDGLIGLITNENSSTIGIIDGSQKTAEFPPHHKIKTVRHTTFIHLPLHGNTSKKSEFEDFQTNDNHFFCDTYDLTRLFPVDGINSPDLGFVWNNGWRRPFEILGIPQVCCYLIQGVCVSKAFDKFGFSLAYVCRRSSLNPGTRYAARGLNDLNAPGNEVECELLFFKDNEFWSERWRRGSIPIRWKTVLSSKLTSPKHTVDKDYFNGTCEYFEDLLKRYGRIPIRCVSLLQTESDHAENEIKEFFTKALNQLFEHNINEVFYTPFDLNQHLHADGSGEAMMDFLSYIGPLGDGDGFAYGTLPNTLVQSQQGLMRFNCADSLDRTNLATFYYAMKLCADWCKEKKLALTSTPDADPNQPNLIIDQAIIDFLAMAFVDSGNVVSRLYTNTQAIKTNAIKKFSPTIVVSMSDTNITLQRRLQNVVNDPVRQRLIEMWTQPAPLSWYHRIDPRHIFIVPRKIQEKNSDDNDGAQFPRVIFSPNIQQFEIESKELLICLPTPMILFSVMILMYPANQKLNGVKITGGLDCEHMETIADICLPAVEATTWLRYRPCHAMKWGFESAPKKYIRFLSFKFDSETQKFAIGNIRLEAKSCLGGDVTYYPRPMRQLKQSNIINNTDNDNNEKDTNINNENKDEINNTNENDSGEEDNEERFKHSFEEFAKTPMGLSDTLELEKTRIGLSICEEARNKLAIACGINPWLSDPRSQLLSTPQFLCAFCRQPLTEAVKYYHQATNLPGLILLSNDKVGFPICSKCNETAENLAQITAAYEEEMKPIEMKPPHFGTGEASHDLIERIQAITNEATSAFLNTQSSILWTQGGSELIAKDETKEYDIFIVQQAIILRLVLEFNHKHHNINNENNENNDENNDENNNENNGNDDDVKKIDENNIEIYDESGNKLDSARINDDQIEFTFKEQPITQRLRFSIKAVNNDIDIKRLQIYYIITEFPLEEAKKHDTEQLKLVPLAMEIMAYDARTRTDVLKLDRPSKIISTMVEMAPEKGVPVPLSVYIALYKNDVLTGMKHIILPDIGAQTKLWYMIDKNGISADTIKVFYADRVSSLKPHVFKFVIH